MRNPDDQASQRQPGAQLAVAALMSIPAAVAGPTPARVSRPAIAENNDRKG